MKFEVEIVKFDPDDPDTYPSVCVDPGEVEKRFGFTGGETLVFNTDGSYVGQLVRTMLPNVTPEGPETVRGGLIGQEPY